MVEGLVDGGGGLHYVNQSWEGLTNRVVGSEQFACRLWQVDQGLQTRVALLQHHRSPQSALRALQSCGQALDALLQFGHCGEPTLLFEAGCGALKAEDRDEEKEDQRGNSGRWDVHFQL